MIRIRTVSLQLVFVLLGATSLSGQASVGLRAGVTNGTVAAGGLDEFDQEPRTSYTVGLSVTVPLREHFGLRLGLAYTGKGTTYGMSRSAVTPVDFEDPVQGTLTYRRDYIEVSAMARAMLPLGGRRASLYALAGPALAFSRKCSVEFWTPRVQSMRWGTVWPRCDLPVDRENRIQLGEGADFGVIGGIGADVELWDLRFSMEALYNIGLTSDTHGNEAVRNRVRTVQFGLSLPFR